MPRPAKTRSLKFKRHLDGIAVFANSEVPGPLGTEIHTLVSSGRKIEEKLSKEDRAGDILQEAREVIEELEEVSPELAKKLKEAMK